jgi:hypothetical protein
VQNYFPWERNETKPWKLLKVRKSILNINSIINGVENWSQQDFAFFFFLTFLSKSSAESVGFSSYVCMSSSLGPTLIK